MALITGIALGLASLLAKKIAQNILKEAKTRIISDIKENIKKR